MTGDLPDGWIIYACRTPYALDVAEIIWRSGHEIARIVDNLSDGPQPSEIGETIATSDLSNADLDRPTVIPLMTPGHRQAGHRDARHHGLIRFPPLVDRTATIARTASMGDGTVVNAGSVIAAATTLADFVQVNRSVSVGHHNVIEEYASLGPGCTLGGHVRLGRGAFVGTGAVCAPEVTIGENAVVGAGAVVVKDVAPNTVVVGNPAKVIRERNPGYGGVAVGA